MIRKRTGYLLYNAEIPLQIKPVRIYCYGRRGNYVGRLEISRAGLAAYTGKKGVTRIADLSWERLFERLKAG